MGRLTQFNKNLIKTVLVLSLREGRRLEPFKFQAYKKASEELNEPEVIRFLFEAFEDISKFSIVEYRKCEIKSVHEFIKTVVRTELLKNSDEYQVFNDLDAKNKPKPKKSVNYKIDWE